MRTPRSGMEESSDLFKKPIQRQIHKLQNLQSHYSDKRSLEHLLLEQFYFRAMSLKLDAEGARYPYQPTFDFLSDIKFFLESTPEDFSADKEIAESIPDAVAENRIQNLMRNHSSDIKKIIADPLAYYDQASARLRKYGSRAPFPEFQKHIAILNLALRSNSTVRSVIASPLLETYRRKLIDRARSLHSNGFPYLETLNYMERAMGFFDVLQRSLGGVKVSELFHSLRWQYYSNVMKYAQPDYVLIPTFHSLRMEDFLAVRGVPVGFVGMALNPTFGDSVFMTSLEAWFHDLNHARRMWHQFVDRAKELGLSILEYSRRSHHYVTSEVLPITKILKTDDEEMKNIKKLSIVIFFEVSHERALPLDRDMLASDLGTMPLSDGRFISETLSEDLSKVSYFRNKIGTVLSIVFRKIEGDFYDQGTNRNINYGSTQWRTREGVLKTGIFLDHALGFGIPEHQQRMNVMDDSGLPFTIAEEIRRKSAIPGSGIEPLYEPAKVEFKKRYGYEFKPMPYFGGGSK